MHYMEGMRLITVLELVAPTPDENVTVTDTEFNNVPVRLYLPRGAPDGLRRAMVYFHGGGWCLGDAGKLCCIAAGSVGKISTVLSSAAFCFVGVATGRGRGLVCHQLKAGGGLGKSPGSCCQEEQAVLCVPVHFHTYRGFISGMKSYDHISRRISNELNAVVVSVK